MKFFLLVILLMFCSVISVAEDSKKKDEVTIFSGYPIRKTEIFNRKSSDLELTDQEYIDYQCIIVKKNGKYYWKSREYIELLKVESGHFYIFFAKNGSGYVKIKEEGLKEIEYLYMEHLHLGLNSISYFGHLGSYRKSLDRLSK